MLDLVPHIGQLVEFPLHIQAGTRPPGGEEATVAVRIAPGGNAEVEMRRQMPLQDAAHPLEYILFRQILKQRTQAPLPPDTGAQRLPALAGSDPPVRYRPRVGCGQRQKLPKIGITPALRPQPLQPGCTWRRQVQLQAGQQHRTPADANRHGLIKIGNASIVKCCGQIAGINPPLGIRGMEARLRPVGAGARQVMRRRHRLGKGQMLEAVQGIVMNEIANRRLRRQNVRQMGHPARQAFGQRQIVVVRHLSHRTPAPIDQRRRQSGATAAPARRPGK